MKIFLCLTVYKFLLLQLLGLPKTFLTVFSTTGCFEKNFAFVNLRKSCSSYWNKSEIGFDCVNKLPLVECFKNHSQFAIDGYYLINGNQFINIFVL